MSREGWGLAFAFILVMVFLFGSTIYLKIKFDNECKDNYFGEYNKTKIFSTEVAGKTGCCVITDRGYLCVERDGDGK
ncbi:hypothetical protein LCGC14_0534620 [marine sediment metagenome]|uniref:Uncharacterized protein n=1 Tax=marine sediment metagenome TaxID=412755 RepID=A0A0F9UG07_9ZZZZ